MSELKQEQPSNENITLGRYIFSMEDMAQFKASPVKRDLLSFVTALGRSTITASYAFDASNHLIGLSPGMACLHGSLRAIAEWLKELPPDENAKARFGNPVFKIWHARLTSRSSKIIECIMNCHVKYVVEGQNDHWDMSILKECDEAGAKAASEDASSEAPTGTTSEEKSHQERVIAELQEYLHHSFGHEMRIDYGTGHECSFFVFLYALCKIGVFGNIPKTSAPSPDNMAPVAVAITSQYLDVCRGIQTEYMLEPAGSHGVWELDDYHCIPFYIGACQMQNHAYDEQEYAPSSIHNDEVLKSKNMLYFQCIRYIKALKKGAPFFESSPMLDDISHLANWAKVSGGLLRLFEGEVLDKRPVVQHFIFGEIFKASWKPSRSAEREAPASTFAEPHFNVDAVAPWALNRAGGGSQGMPSTKAPWAK